MAVFIYSATRRFIPAHVATEEINNGLFTSNTIGWTSQGGVISSVASQLNIAYTSAAAYAHQNIVIIPNESYLLKVTRESASHASFLTVSDSFTTTPVGIIDSRIIPSGSFGFASQFTFSSPLALCNVSIGIGDTGESGTGVFDTMSCKLDGSFALTHPINYTIEIERETTSSRSLGGNTQSLVKSRSTKLNVTLSQIATADVPEVDEFLYSVSRGEQFALDRNLESSVDLSLGTFINMQMEGGWSKSRMANSDYFSFNFTCREVSQ